MQCVRGEEEKALLPAALHRRQLKISARGPSACGLGGGNGRTGQRRWHRSSSSGEGVSWGGSRCLARGRRVRQASAINRLHSLRIAVPNGASSMDAEQVARRALALLRRQSSLRVNREISQNRPKHDAA